MICESRPCFSTPPVNLGAGTKRISLSVSRSLSRHPHHGSLFADLYRCSIQSCETESLEVFGEGVHKILQFGDRNFLTKVESSHRVTPVMNTGEIAAHSYIESKLINFATNRERAIHESGDSRRVERGDVTTNLLSAGRTGIFPST